MQSVHTLRSLLKAPKRKAVIQLIAIATLLNHGSLWAKVSQDEANKLGNLLTPLGAEKAGNADGTIPAWTGGIVAAPALYVEGKGYVDPYAEDKPLFTIDGSNYPRYQDYLSAGQIAMFKRYPSSWQMNVYPSRRSASYPQKVYAAAKNNATQSTLVDDGNGLASYSVAYPFPIPTSGLEVLWNHLTRYRGDAVKRYYAQAVPQAGVQGAYVVSKINDQFLFNENVGDKSKENGDILFYFRQDVTAPARLAGVKLLVHETVNQVSDPRRSWLYSAGQRRLRRAPNVAYDSPGTASDGVRTTDNFDMFSGAPDRYDWELVGKREMYIPYNSYKFASKKLTYKEIVQPGHVKANLLRFERHRVWHIRAALKPGARHIYAKRDIYLDEDSYQIVAVDHYDGHNQLWRVGESYTINYYNERTVWTAGDAVYDLLSGRYVIGLLSNEEPAYEFNADLDASYFTPAELRRASTR